MLIPVLFPELFNLSKILKTRVYKDICLTNVPVSGLFLRNRKKDLESLEFLNRRLELYIDYISKLITNLTDRFDCETFKICKVIGKLINFDIFFSP